MGAQASVCAHVNNISVSVLHQTKCALKLALVTWSYRFNDVTETLFLGYCVTRAKIVTCGK